MASYKLFLKLISYMLARVPNSTGWRGGRCTESCSGPDWNIIGGSYSCMKLHFHGLANLRISEKGWLTFIQQTCFSFSLISHLLRGVVIPSLTIILLRTAVAMYETSQGRANGACGERETESRTLELIRLVKEQNNLLQGIQASHRGTSGFPAHESADRPIPHTSLLGEPVSRKWGPLGSFLMHYLHQDGPTKLSAMRESTFLEQARSAFSRIVTELKLVRPHRSNPGGYSLDPKIIEALEKQLSSWPKELSGDENLGLGRTFSEDSNVYVHGSLNDGNHVSFGSVW